MCGVQTDFLLWPHHERIIVFSLESDACFSLHSDAIILNNMDYCAEILVLHPQSEAFS